MKKSIGLLSALVVSTTFIVNCQKAPDKRRVRPSGGLGAVQTDTIGEKAKLPTKVCSTAILNDFNGFVPLYKKALANRVSDKSTAEEIKVMQADLTTLEDKCDKVLPALEALGVTENYSCFNDKGVKNEKNILAKSQVAEWCNYVGAVAMEDHKHKTKYAVAFEQEQKVKADAVKVEKELLKKPLAMSKEARSLLLPEKTNGVSFLVEGVVQSSDSSMKAALAASKTVCTFLGNGIVDFKEELETTLVITQTNKAERSEIIALDADFKGQATTLTTLISQGELKDEPISLLCLNLDSAKLSVDKIMKVFDKAIAAATVQVSTEITGDSSAAAAVVEAAATVSATEAVVPVTATQSVIEQAPEQIVEGLTEVAALKEKAERLEAEAVAAEAEVTKLESENARAEDIKEAKAKARITRDSADSAKAEYELVSKKVTVSA